MVNKDAFQKYFDAGVAFTAMTRARAEELVQELVQSGEFQSSDARAKVDELLERTRKVAPGVGVPGPSRGVDPTRPHGHHQRRGSGQAGGAAPFPDGGSGQGGHLARQEGGGQEDNSQKSAGQEGPGQEDWGPQGSRPRKRRPRSRRPRSQRGRRQRPRNRRSRRLRRRRRHRPPAPGRQADRADTAPTRPGPGRTGPGGQSAAGRRPHRAGVGAGVRVGGRQAGPPGGRPRTHRTGGAAEAVRQPGRGEARAPPWTDSPSTPPDCGPWMPAPRPVVSPTACSRPVPPRSSLSTSDGASSTSDSGSTTG